MASNRIDHSTTPDFDDERLDEVVDEFLRRHESESSLTPEAFAASFPESWREGIIRECRGLLSLENLSSVDADAETSPTSADFGPFRFIRRLGFGGVATVDLVVDSRSRRRVALKMLHPHLSGVRTIVRRFHREAIIGFPLKHPNIVPVIESGETNDRHWIVREYVEGENLAQSMDAHALRWSELAKKEGAREATLFDERIKMAISVGIDVARALGHAHSQKVVHRDVKPQNIIVDGEGHAFLTDFGLASARGFENLTVNGEFFGSPHYASPEQIRMENGGVAASSDLFSLGVVLYEVATGMRPFEGRNVPQVLHAVVYDDPAPPRARNPQIDRSLESVILRLLEKDPRDRYRSAIDLVVDLERVRTGRRPIDRRPGPWVRRLQRVAVHKWALIGGLTFTVAIVIGVVLAWQTLDRRHWPRISVVIPSGNAADVVAYEIDAIGSTVVSMHRLGSAPFDDAVVPAGLYRFVASDPEGGFSEAIRFVAVDESVTLLMEPRDDTKSLDGMVLIEEASISLEIGVAADAGRVTSQAFPVRVAEFWIDRREVTIGEYVDFLLRTRRSIPDSWPPTFAVGAIAEDIRDLPAVGLTFDEMLAYASFQGKRLPTLAEWQLAGRGENMDPYPWGRSADGIADRAAMRAVRRASLRPAKTPWDVYLRDAHSAVLPVSLNHPADRNGLLHMLGNAWETTATPKFVDRVGKPVPLGGFVSICGLCFQHDVEDVVDRGGLAARGHLQMDIPDFAVGFRCARSVRR